MPLEKIQPQKNQKSSDQGPSAFGDHPFGQAGGMRQMAPPPLQFVQGGEGDKDQSANSGTKNTSNSTRVWGGGDKALAERIRGQNDANKSSPSDTAVMPGNADLGKTNNANSTISGPLSSTGKHPQSGLDKAKKGDGPLKRVNSEPKKTISDFHFEWHQHTSNGQNEPHLKIQCKGGLKAYLNKSSDPTFEADRILKRLELEKNQKNELIRKANEMKKDLNAGKVKVREL